MGMGETHKYAVHYASQLLSSALGGKQDNQWTILFSLLSNSAVVLPSNQGPDPSGWLTRCVWEFQQM